MHSPDKRRLFRMLGGDTATRFRMPWIISESTLVSQCTQCLDCVSECPEQIIKPDAAGFPEILFDQGECSFCKACVDICTVPLFDLNQAPWPHRAVINDSCLAHQQVYCQNCKDCCPVSAITIHYLSAQLAIPQVNDDICNGCGACIAPCPNSSIQLKQYDHNEACVNE